MLLLGLLLIVLAAAVIAYMVVATAGMSAVPLDYGILNLDIPPLWLFLSGVLTLAVAALGFWMIGAGARAKARKSREVRELRKQAKDADRRAQRQEDARDLGTPRGGRASDTYPTGSTGTGSTAADRSRLDLDR